MDLEAASQQDLGVLSKVSQLMEAPNLLLWGGECGKMTLPLPVPSPAPSRVQWIHPKFLSVTCPPRPAFFAGCRQELGCTGNLKPRG